MSLRPFIHSVSPAELNQAQQTVDQYAKEVGVLPREVIPVFDQWEASHCLLHRQVPIYTSLWPKLDEEERRFDLVMYLVQDGLKQVKDHRRLPLVAPLVMMTAFLIYCAAFISATAALLLVPMELCFLAGVLYLLRQFKAHRLFNETVKMLGNPGAGEGAIRKRLALSYDIAPEDVKKRFLARFFYNLQIPEQYRRQPSG